MVLAERTAPAIDGLRLAGTLILLVRTLEQHLRRMPAADGLSIGDLGLLGQIDRGADCPSELARSLRMDPARVTHVTDRLVALGYVTRASDLVDRRRWRLSLTQSGAARLADCRAETVSAVEALIQGLSLEERDAVAIGVTGIRRVLDLSA